MILLVKLKVARPKYSTTPTNSSLSRQHECQRDDLTLRHLSPIHTAPGPAGLSVLVKEDSSEASNSSLPGAVTPVRRQIYLHLGEEGKEIPADIADETHDRQKYPIKYQR